VEVLWLSGEQLDILSMPFTLLPQRPSSVDWVLATFHESVEKAAKQNRVSMSDPIASLTGKGDARALALEFAQALAVLEDGMRRADPTGECIRWSARKYSRDLLSFPERVRLCYPFFTG
jgi:hypothetical protein